MSGLISNILVGVDFSPGSAQALRYGAQLSLQVGASLHVLNVHGSSVALSDDTYAFGFDIQDYLNKLRQAEQMRRAALAKFVEDEVAKPLCEKVRTIQHLRDGDVRSEVLSCIDQLRADLVIVGSRGRGPLKQVLLGSVSGFLCQHSPIPILVIPTLGHGARSGA